MRAFKLVALGVTLFVFGLAASWAQDVAAPWINTGEAQMRGTVSFDAGGGKYRVVTSGPTRPELEQTACDVVSDGASKRVLGGAGGVNANSRFGVSRVLEFKTGKGRTQVTCGHRILRAATGGRFQVVPADGIVSKAIVAAFVPGGLSLAAGGVLLFLAYRRREPLAPSPY